MGWGGEGWTHPQLWCLEPGCLPRGQREHLTERLGRAGLRAVAWDAQCWTPWGLAQSSVPASSWGPGHREQTHLSPGQEWLPPPQLSESLPTATTLDLLSRPPACK